MTFSATDFLISIPITAIIIFVIVLLCKRAKAFPSNMGCFLGCIIMFWLVLCFVGGCSKRRMTKAESNLVRITLVSSGEIIKIPKKELVGRDSVYREGAYVYMNDTGRELVEYMVKYTANGYDASDKIYGNVIRPNEYFYWHGDDKDYYMFRQPPTSTTIITRTRYGRSHQLDFVYLHFIDYIENVPEYVSIIK